MGVLPRQRLPRPTVSVGNLTTGGTGKTPVVQLVARTLMAHGHTPCILLRGYGAAAGQLADEALEHQQFLGELGHVQQHPDRRAGAAAALAARPDLTCFILDDGFQHQRVRRDFDIVLVDATNPWGYGHCLPRGLLREPRSALRRADCVLVTRAEQVERQALQQLAAEIAQHHGQPPLAPLAMGWSGYRDAAGNNHAQLPSPPHAAVCGLGNPHAFFRSATLAGATLALAQAKPDHHPWTAEDMRLTLAKAHAAGASCLLLPEKDFVKWRAVLPDTQLHATVPPLRRPVLTLTIQPLAREMLDRELRQRIPLPDGQAASTRDVLNTRK
jgi:tetraacyldisaccharide 4'-kinase